MFFLPVHINYSWIFNTFETGLCQNVFKLWVNLSFVLEGRKRSECRRINLSVCFFCLTLCLVNENVAACSISVLSNKSYLVRIFLLFCLVVLLRVNTIAIQHSILCKNWCVKAIDGLKECIFIVLCKVLLDIASCIKVHHASLKQIWLQCRYYIKPASAFLLCSPSVVSGGNGS